MKKFFMIFVALLITLSAGQLKAQTQLNPASMTFPYYITTPGHYILTGNITITSQTTIYAIVIDAAGVTLDLNGYTIAGPLDCTQSSCSVTYATAGILSQYPGDIIQNGRITGFYICADAYTSGTIQNLTTTGCFEGISAGSNSIIRGNNVNNCTNLGIYAQQSLVTDNNVWDNQYGILSVTSNTMKNEIYGNTYDGLLIYNGGLVSNNVIYGNATDESSDGSKIVYTSNACTKGAC
jgi:hypothetical protein